MAAYGKEGIELITRLVQKVHEEGTVKPGQSSNLLKQMRRALGAAMFSPEAVGYFDIIENGLTEGLSAREILGKVRNASESLVESYSFAKGIFEAHHVFPLNALRDNFMQLSPEEQDQFLRRLSDSGWELGDSPQQLMNTLQSRMSHQGKTPELKKGKDTALKQLFADVKLPDGEIVSHGAPDGVVRTNWPKMTAKGATTGKELFEQFGELANVYQKQAVLGNVGDLGLRKAVLDATGIDISQMSPELAAKIKKSEDLQQKILTVASQNYNPPSKEGALGLLQEITGKMGFDADPKLTQRITKMLQNPGIQEMAQKLGYLNNIPGAAAVPIVGGGIMAAGALGDAVQASEGVSNMNQAQSPRQYAKGALQTLGAGAGLMGVKTTNLPLAAGGAIAGGLAGIMDWVDQQQAERTRRTDLETGLGRSTAYTVGSNEPDEEYKPPELVPTVQPKPTPNRYERRNR